jgi:exonuclease SbcC
MIINNISIKNLKSFGNEEQILELGNEGNLILLSGKNGSGKSSIIDSFDYVFYNKVKGRKSKKVKLSSLPNRINGNLEVKVDFDSIDGTNIKINRGYKPSNLQLWEDDVENLKAGKDKIDQMIENYIGIDYETFKGFISMSINDFKNFISLSNEEKKLLLDKLFNLEVINVLNKILNNLSRDNKKDIEVLNREIDIINDNIDSINESIENAKKNKKDNNLNKLELIKEQISNNKEPFLKLKEKLVKIEEKKSQIIEKINEEKSNLIKINMEIKKIDEQLELFENDKCPTCHADLDSSFHKGLKESFIEKKEGFLKLKIEISKRGKDFKDKEDKIKEIEKKANESYNELNGTLKSLKNDYDKLIKENEKEEDPQLKEFYSSIDKLKDKLKHAEINISEAKDKEIYHKYLKSILSEDGVKKSIIQNIVDPINHYVEENLQKMHLPFEVILDDTFSANITSLGDEIDIDTLSTGENKAINISIMLAYLKLIRTKRQINILFLDEVFSSIDVERINDVISLLRDLADHSKINIFLVHHSILDSNYFDKIIKVEKNVFSYIEEID